MYAIEHCFLATGSGTRPSHKIRGKVLSEKQIKVLIAIATLDLPMPVCLSFFLYIIKATQPLKIVHAYQQSCLLTIVPIDHHTFQPSCLSAI